MGTKIELAERTGRYDTVAHDLVAMIADDSVRNGVEPVLILSVLDASALALNGKPYLEEARQLAKGYIAAAKDANVAIINGETAELGRRVGGFGSAPYMDEQAHRFIVAHFNGDNWEGIRALCDYLGEQDMEKKKDLLSRMGQEEIEFIKRMESLRTLNFNWSGTAIGFAREDRLITGQGIVPGESIVGLREIGFRSNGLSLVRKVLRDAYGEDWHLQLLHGKTLGETVLQPSQIYTQTVVDMFGGYEGEEKVHISGIAHITGGGIPEKLGRILALSNRGLGVVIDNPFIVPHIMRHVQQQGKVPDREAYRSWNMGHGMLIVTPDPLKAISVALEHGIDAKKVGHVTEDSTIRILNQGMFSSSEPELAFSVS